MIRSVLLTSCRFLALSLFATSAVMCATCSSYAANRRIVRASPAKPSPSSKPSRNNPTSPRGTVVTLPSGTNQIVPDPTQCVLETAHQLHPSRFIGGRIDRAGRGGALIRGPIIRQVEKGIAEAQAAVAQAMAQALVEMKRDMLSQINTAFNVGASVGACDTILSNYAAEAEKKCAANQGRFAAEASAECSAPGKSTEQRLTCACLAPSITGALYANCVALGQSPEILAAVNAAHASCKQREIRLPGFLSGLTDLLGNRASGNEE